MSETTAAGRTGDGDEASGDAEANIDATVRDPVTAASRIRRRAESVRRDELADALRRLEAEDDLTDGQRRAVERMTEHIAASLVAQATAALRADDERATAAALALFGGDPDAERADERA
jgi:glutamyl-tRNA reductase